MSDNIHDDPDQSPQDDDSAVLLSGHAAPTVLKVYQTGPLTVVGFGGDDVPDEVCIAAYREQLLALVKQHECRVLAFDLSGVKLVPSGMLGVLVTLRKQVEKVEIYNASPDVQDVLRLTNLITLFELKDVAV
jgi:anti-sigma B factor antagonist